MQSNKYNKENHLILNQIYDILEKFWKLDKKIMLCKVPAHKGVKGNEEVSWPSGGLGTPNCKGNWKTALVSYTILNHASKNGKMHTMAVSNTRSKWAGYGLDTLD